MYKRKLIEVALPLEKINAESAREKSIRHGHPSTLHLWWARRPLAAARAVLFAQLVDDPSAHPDRYPTEEAQRARRAELHELIEQLVVWENTTDDALLERARKEIRDSCGGNPPPILDPFAGGGTIPLEAQRLGLEAYASDLNPVAVLINKALIEIPPKFGDRPPVFPGLADTRASWRGAEGLAADVRAYGEWMRDQAGKEIGHLYPKATMPDGAQAPVIAWIWARTVRCPNPGCGIEMPLVRSWWLGKKKGKEAYVVPRVVAHPSDPSGKRVEFEIGHDLSHAPTTSTDGTVGRHGGMCVSCRSLVSLTEVRRLAHEEGLGRRLMAVVCEGQRRRIYLPPSGTQEQAAEVQAPADVPHEPIPFPNHDVDRLPMYGMMTWSDAFTPRQLVAMTTFCHLVESVQMRAQEAALKSGLTLGKSLGAGGVGARAYAEAIATYLGMVPSGLANLSSSVSTWRVPAESTRTTFARQALPMAWDFAESDDVAKAEGVIDRMSRVIELLPVGLGVARQADASNAIASSFLVSTDPPYYDNISYSDLSDFFYVWLRRTLRGIYPELMSTVLVPKRDELVANPYRHGGRAGAFKAFEAGFRSVFETARSAASDLAPITVYYAFKQSESSSEGQVSSGWQTLLEGMIAAGWTITATWPMRTEATGRMVAVDTNALASSIVLALRPRPEDAPTTDRAGFLAALHAELPDALRRLQQGGIAPVDLPQAAIGPGMAVFSRYAKVVEAGGQPMTVHSALARINEILDQVLNEQEGDFDPTTRFAIAWYRQHGYATGTFGDAEGLALGRNTSVAAMDRAQILSSRANKVTLIKPSDTEPDYDVAVDEHVSAWEVLHHLIRLVQSEGLDPAARLLAAAASRPIGPIDPDLVKELSFLLFSVAEKNGWTADAVAFNTLATSWPDIATSARHLPAASQPVQAAFTFEEDE